MRVAPLLLCLLAPAALAQVPDTTSAWRYLPLAVGNAWEYVEWRQECDPFCDFERQGYRQLTVEGQHVGDQHTYQVIRDARYDTERALRYEFEWHVRFDTTLAYAVGIPMAPAPPGRSSACGAEAPTTAAEWGGGEVAWPVDLFASPCRLDAPFGSVAECGAPTGGGYGVPYDLAGETRTVTLKQFYSLGGPADFVADYGFMGVSFCGGWDRLTWARVGGEEIGAIQVGDTAPDSAPRLGVRVTPNPSRGAVSVTLELPAPSVVHAELVDALGRRVAVLHDGSLAAGPTRLATPELSPGAYVVRATTAEGRASAVLHVVR